MADKFITAVAIVVAIIVGAACTHLRYAWREWRKAVRAVPVLRGITVARGRGAALAGVVFLVVLVVAAHGG